MRVFITGATGFVGSRIIERLIERGHRVTSLVRKPEKANLPPEVDVAEGDALDATGLSEKMKGCDAVVNLIGIIREFPNQGITFERLHIGVTRNLVEAANRSGIKRFIQMSANGVRENGITGYQKTKYEAERIVKSRKLEWTIFRPSLIFGKPPDGRTEFCTEIGRVIKAAPFIPVFGGGEYLFQPIHVSDVARCFVGALEKPDCAFRTFHLGGGDIKSYMNILDAICLGMGKSPKPKVRVPWKMAKPFISLMGRFAFFPATAEQIEMLLEGSRVPESDFKEMFEIEPVPFTPKNLSYLR